MLRDIYAEETPVLYENLLDFANEEHRENLQRSSTINHHNGVQVLLDEQKYYQSTKHLYELCEWHSVSCKSSTSETHPKVSQYILSHLNTVPLYEFSIDYITGGPLLPELFVPESQDLHDKGEIITLFVAEVDHGLEELKVDTHLQKGSDVGRLNIEL
jgi:hypothetical protein